MAATLSATCHEVGSMYSASSITSVNGAFTTMARTNMRIIASTASSRTVRRSLRNACDDSCPSSASFTPNSGFRRPARDFSRLSVQNSVRTLAAAAVRLSVVSSFFSRMTPSARKALSSSDHATNGCPRWNCDAVTQNTLAFFLNIPPTYLLSSSVLPMPSSATNIEALPWPVASSSILRSRRLCIARVCRDCKPPWSRRFTRFTRSVPSFTA
mmetsp:Transcript_9271/g.32677  ORF Transcript_9271/g.32677 Transcript_9271/m.32677 type:complete len:213 (+) Transcript_9271:4442-5080(+)